MTLHLVRKIKTSDLLIKDCVSATSSVGALSIIIWSYVFLASFNRISIFPLFNKFNGFGGSGPERRRSSSWLSKGFIIFFFHSVLLSTKESTNPGTFLS